jgi:hypothetical protein
MEINDDDLVSWTVNDQHMTCTVGEARDMLRVTHPDWSDDQIEQWLFARIVIEGRMQ